MSETARIDSIAELRGFRVALIKFTEACNVALGDAEADMQRTLQWLERDQISYWNGQLAKRAEIVVSAEHKNTFVAHHQGEDLYGCIDQAFHKVQQQISAHKERFRNRKHSGE